MATLRQLPSGSWNAQVRIKGQAPQSKTFKTEQEASLWASSIEAECRSVKVHTVASIGALYVETLLARKGSYHHALARLKHLSSVFPMPMDQITKVMVNEYKHKRLEKVKPATCRTELEFLSRLFKYARRELLLEIANPLTDIALPKPSKPSDKVVSQGELMKLLSALSPTTRLITELAYETAMRRSEIVTLRLEHLHLEDRLVDVVDGKNGTRSVPLTMRAVALFHDAIALSKKKRVGMGRLFKIQAHSVSQAVRKARIKLGMDESVRLHQLRHTRITNVAKKGFNNAQIMIVSGHRDTRSVARYSHLNAKDVLHLID
ncbi:tyrosine-type recombinase/integrase [Pseudomonas sp. Marseille-Q7302]